jgi:hypothetical protein
MNLAVCWNIRFLKGMQRSYGFRLLQLTFKIASERSLLKLTLMIADNQQGSLRDPSTTTR